MLVNLILAPQTFYEPNDAIIPSTFEEIKAQMLDNFLSNTIIGDARRHNSTLETQKNKMHLFM